MPDIDWIEISRERYAAYLAGAYVGDPTGTISITDFILDPSGVVGDKIPILVYSHIALDPATKDRNSVLSDDNLTVTGALGPGAVGTTGPGWTSGKLYLEVTVNSASALVAIGAGEANAFRHIPGNGDSFSAGFWSFGGTPPTYPSYTTGDVIGMAVNMNPGTSGGIVRIYWSVNGTWVQDPASTDGFFISGHTVIGTPIVPMFFVDTGQSLTVNYGAAAFAHTPPTGYSAWVTSATAGVVQVNQAFPALRHDQNYHRLLSLLQTGSAAHYDPRPLPELDQTATATVT